MKLFGLILLAVGLLAGTAEAQCSGGRCPVRRVVRTRSVSRPWGRVTRTVIVERHAAPAPLPEKKAK